MVKKFSRAYILGSGFSKSFSEKVPTIMDLTDRLFKLKSEEYETLTSFVNRLFERSNELEEFRNIENIATLFFSKRIYKDFEEELYYEKLRFELIKFIFHEIQNRRVEEGKISTLSKFIDHAINDSQSDPAALITFNYDLLIEEILRLKNKNNPLKIVIDYGLEFDTYGHKKFEAGIDQLSLRLMKMHGSFNWFRAKGSNSNDIRDIYLVEEESPMFGIHRNDIPAYIPMAHVKNLFLNGTLYATIWARALEILQEVDQIVFIGYGFPLTDLNNLALFLDFKDKIEAINILEVDGSAKLQRLNKLFGNQKVFNMEAKQFIETHVIR